MELIGIYGAGGFAREVDWLVSELEGVMDPRGPRVVAYIDDTAAAEQSLNGKPVLSLERFIAKYPEALISIAIGNSQARADVARRCKAAGRDFVTLIAADVHYSRTVAFGDGCVICAGVALTVHVVLGAHVHVNLNCTIGHDAILEDYVTLAPGVHVSGNVHIKRGAYIGTGAAIINGTSEHPLIIGENAVVGANACVTGDVEPACLYAGVPAVLKKHY
jgi:sugar O-acyltransferase (sialic acid O-acetyltransferase NeuD family)